MALDLGLLTPQVLCHTSVQLHRPVDLLLLPCADRSAWYGLHLARVDIEVRSDLGRTDAKRLEFLRRQPVPLDCEVVLLALVLLRVPDALAFGLGKMALDNAKHVVGGIIEPEVERL